MKKIYVLVADGVSYKIGVPIKGGWAKSQGDFIPTQFNKLSKTDGYTMKGYHTANPSRIILRLVGKPNQKFYPIYKKGG